MLKNEVKTARLPLSKIVELFNRDLQENLKHTSEGITSLLKDFNLDTKKGTGNKSELIWETEKINKLFTKIPVTSVTTVTQKADNNNLHTEDKTLHSEDAFNENETHLNSFTDVIDFFDKHS